MSRKKGAKKRKTQRKVVILGRDTTEGDRGKKDVCERATSVNVDTVGSGVRDKKREEGKIRADIVERETEKGENSQQDKIIQVDKDAKVSDNNQIDRGIWETLNSEYPWVKVAIVLTVILFVFGIWKMHFLSRPVSVTETRGFYAELGLKPPVKKRDLKDKKLIALTFDDGPAPTTTSRLLDILKEKKVPVTFFVLGMMARNYPDIVKREVAEGHELASHTTNHANLSKMSVEQIQQDMNESCQILINVTGKCAELVRPPYGAINENVIGGIARPLITWSVDTEDWKSRNADKIRAEVKRSSFNGAVVLFHDIYDTTVDAIPMVIDDFRAAGYEFVTISEMAQARGVKLERGGVYGVFRP